MKVYVAVNAHKEHGQFVVGCHASREGALSLLADHRGEPLSLDLKISELAVYRHSTNGLEMCGYILPENVREDASRRIRWEFDGSGEWTAYSCAHDDGVHFEYRIQVCDDGTFDISKSDGELVPHTPKPECLPLLSLAKAACEKAETGFFIRESMSIIGSKKSLAKTNAARVNGAKPRPAEKRKGWPKGKKRGRPASRTNASRSKGRPSGT
jgi:hypothetical protein